MKNIKMNYTLFINYLIGFTSLFSVISLASTASPKYHGKRLGEVCDYRRTCLDVNAKCVGQIRQKSLFAGKEHLFQYKCECERFYVEEDGKCQFSLRTMVVPVAVGIGFVGLIILLILCICLFQKKGRPKDTLLLSEESDLEKIVWL